MPPRFVVPPALGALLRGRRRWLVAVAVLLLLALAFSPWWGGALGAALVRSKGGARLGVPVDVAEGRLGPGGLRLRGIVVGAGGASHPVAQLDAVTVPLRAIWGGGRVLVEGLRIHVVHGGADDNVSELLRRLRGEARGGTTGPPAARQALPEIEIRDGALTVRDASGGHALEVGAFSAMVTPGVRFVVNASQVTGSVRLRGDDRDPAFGAASVAIDGALVGLSPAHYPKVEVKDGFLRLLPKLGLTGIRGGVAPRGGAGPGPSTLAVDLAGSWGGARETLWTATGQVTPGPGPRGLEGSVALKAARFSLGKVADVLPPEVIDPEDTLVDAALDLTLAKGRIGIKGNLEVSGLSLQHESVAAEPVLGMALGLRLDASLDPSARRLDLALFEGRLRDLVGRLSGSIELPAGTFTFKDGSTMPVVPRIDLALEVPRVPCARALASIPPAVVPHLVGYTLKGHFDAAIRARIDWADLDALVLDGKVGIDGCKVALAPEEVTALSGDGALNLVVEVPLPPPGEPGAVDLMAFSLGPDNPEWVPYEQISPHVISSIMTTEDNGFFKHRGWVSSEFKTALRRNLAGGGFRLGASSITMQTVKNVLLTREKTLSRKLQELFLVWHIEQILPKERILELYFNAIEFGPRLHGIGPAARHYFGKTAAQLSPLEAAFISSILPSPKRRYIQYCHGALYPPWDKYVRRILARIHERGRITAEEYALAAAAPLVFDLTERPAPEKDCLEWIKRITQRAPEPDPVEPE